MGAADSLELFSDERRVVAVFDEQLKTGPQKRDQRAEGENPYQLFRGQTSEREDPGAGGRR